MLDGNSLSNTVPQRGVSMTHSLNSQFTSGAKRNAIINASWNLLSGQSHVTTAHVLKYKN
jgi:hypothetical protein